MQLIFKSFILIIATLMFTLLNSSYLHAEDKFQSEVYVQQFSGGTTVFTPVLSTSKELDNTTLTFKLVTDFVSTGNGLFDSISGASKPSARKKSDSKAVGEDDDGNGGGDDSGGGGSTLEDVRKEIAIGLKHMVSSNTELLMTYDYSNEKDYISQTPSISLIQNFFSKNSTVSLGYSPMFDTIHGKYMTNTKRKRANTYYTSFTQVISPKTLAMLSYSITDETGQTSSGTRQVTINNIDVNEALPDYRKKETATLNLNQYLFSRSAVQFTYRYYWDDWDIKTHTANTELFKYIGNNGLLRFRYRYYTQPDSFFYKETYTGNERFVTPSNQYRNMETHMLGVRFHYDLKMQAGSSFENGNFEMKFDNYRQSTGESGNIVMLGVNLIF